MTKQQAYKIYDSWKIYLEIAEKLGVFFTSIPESYLPYPKDTLEEALNIVAGDYFDLGDEQAVRNIEMTKEGYLWIHTNDETALRDISKSIETRFKNKEIMEIYLEQLRTAKDDWLRIRASR